MRRFGRFLRALRPGWEDLVILVAPLVLFWLLTHGGDAGVWSWIPGRAG